MTTNHGAERVTVTPKGSTYWRYGTGPDAFGVQPGEVTFEVPGRFDVTVCIGHDKDTSRPGADSVTITRRADGPAIGSRSVATDAYVGGLVRLAIEALSFPSPTGRAIEAVRGQVMRQQAATEQLRKLYGHARGGRSATGTADRAQLVKKAAAAYRKAQKGGRPTTRAVQEACYAGSSLARKLVSEARDSGLLPEAGGTTRPKL